MTAANVILWGTRIGSVVFDENRGVGSFEYDPDFRKSGIEVSPIMMPLSGRVYEFPSLNRQSFHGLPGLLADSLPDKFGNAVIEAWLRSHNRAPESFNPVERLCYTGSRGMGALEFEPATGPGQTEQSSIEIDKLVELASKVLQMRQGLRTSLGNDSLEEIIKVGSSAGGARAKAVIAWNEETGDIRSGQIPAGKGYGYWLMKFDGVSGNGDKEGPDAPHYTRIEYAYHLMARQAGLVMQECRLLEENGRAHFLTKRFDRDEQNGKLHMQSLGAIAHMDFNSSGAHSYEDAARVMRQLGLTGGEVVQFFRRMVFNVLAWNHDDHVKNISFLMDRAGIWSLSPAYDVTYSFNPDGMWTGRHQMSVNGKRQDIGFSDFLASGRNMGLSESLIRKTVLEVCESLSHWDSFASSAGLGKAEARKIGRMLSVSTDSLSRKTN